MHELLIKYHATINQENVNDVRHKLDTDSSFKRELILNNLHIVTQYFAIIELPEIIPETDKGPAENQVTHDIPADDENLTHSGIVCPLEPKDVDTELRLTLNRLLGSEAATQQDFNKVILVLVTYNIPEKHLLTNSRLLVSLLWRFLQSSLMVAVILLFQK